MCIVVDNSNISKLAGEWTVFEAVARYQGASEKGE